METPLNASATTAGALLSTNTFVVPPYQREYAWTSEEVGELWSDLQRSLEDESYFLGLVIVTEDSGRKHVVDGQQRILTLTLLAAVLFHEARKAGRHALADRISADFLKAINYETDASQPRVLLSDERDNDTFQQIIDRPDDVQLEGAVLADGLSPRLLEAYRSLRSRLQKDLSDDPFKRLGVWADFLTNHVYFAVFVHPDPASAYRVFEVINTRGRELTTADLLKNYILSQTAPAQRAERYEDWKSISSQLEPSGQSSLVQFIRHVTSLSAGYVLPRDLFDYLAGRESASGRDKRQPPSASELMTRLADWAPLYVQLIDPSAGGPAESDWLPVFASLEELGVLSVRPVAMALTRSSDATTGLRALLRLVVRRIVVGNLGTGNVERRFSEAARKISISGEWQPALRDLDDLNPSKSDFVEQLRKRSLNKGTLTFLRRSIIQKTITPSSEGYIHAIRPRQAPEWDGFPDDEYTYWGSTLGNTVLASVERRPRYTATWQDFKAYLLPFAIPDEIRDRLEREDWWDAEEVEAIGLELARAAASVWFAAESISA